jgi:hypothetical protein
VTHKSLYQDFCTCMLVIFVHLSWFYVNYNCVNSIYFYYILHFCATQCTQIAFKRTLCFPRAKIVANKNSVQIITVFVDKFFIIQSVRQILITTTNDFIKLVIL